MSRKWIQRSCVLFGFAFTLSFAIVPRAEAVVTFQHYRVPSTVSKRAARDIEFWWSSTYVDSNFSLVGGLGLTDLDRFGITLCETYSNTLHYNLSDVKLVYDYLAFPHSSRQATYDTSGTASVGFRVLAPTYLDKDAAHIDLYLFAPNMSDANDLDWYDQAHRTMYGDMSNNYGFPCDSNGSCGYSSLTLSAHEDTSSGSATPKRGNALIIPGPRFSDVGSTSSTTGWHRPDGLQSAMFAHEFQHVLNALQPPDTTGSIVPHSEFWSEAAAALAGGPAPGPLRYDVDHSISFMQQNYQAWGGLANYFAINFRGTDTTFAGRSDDLLWRWSHGNDQTLNGLAARLDSTECLECRAAIKPYFHGLDPAARLGVILHNWRVANFVNNPFIYNKQYGFDTTYHYDPRVYPGVFQDTDQNASNNSTTTPMSLTATASWRTQELSITANAGRPLFTKWPAGAEYFVIHAGGDLGSSGDTLVVRINAENVVQWHRTPTLECGEFDYRGRLRASVVSYSHDTTELFWHPEWATTVQMQSVDIDSTASDIVFTIPQFGVATKAVCVVVTSEFQDVESWIRMAASVGTAYLRFSAGLRRSPFPATDPLPVATTTYASDLWGTWAPSGSELAFVSKIPYTSTYTQVYRVSSSGRRTTG